MASSRQVGPAPDSAVADAVAAVKASGAALAARLPAASGMDPALSRLASKTPHFAVTNLDAWLALYRAVARGNGGEPDAGRHLLAWAHEAGFTDVTCSASAWCFASPDDRAWWSETWAERTTASPLAEQAVVQGLATTADLEAMGRAWREWSAHPDAWFSVLHGEILARP